MEIKALGEIDGIDGQRLYQSSQNSVFCLPSMRSFFAEYYGANASDHSFAIMEAGSCVALCWITQVGAELNFWGRPAIYLWDESHLNTKAIHKKVWEYLEGMGRGKTLRLGWEPALARQSWSNLREQQVMNEGLIPLEVAEDKLLQGIRKSYRSLINWGKKNLDTKILDQTNITADDIQQFMNFHQAVAGKVTRSAHSWTLQLEMIKRGEGYVVMASFEGELASACMVLHSKFEAHYGVGVYDRTLMERNLALAHFPLWQAVMHAKKIGLKRFNLGDVAAESTDKEESIAMFKRGFAIDIEATVVGLYQWNESNASLKDEAETSA